MVVMIGQRYKQGNGDHKLFVKKHDKKVVILVYVDDMVVIEDDR